MIAGCWTPSSSTRASAPTTSSMRCESCCATAQASRPSPTRARRTWRRPPSSPSTSCKPSTPRRRRATPRANPPSSEASARSRTCSRPCSRSPTGRGAGALASFCRPGHPLRSPGRGHRPARLPGRRPCHSSCGRGHRQRQRRHPRARRRPCPRGRSLHRPQRAAAARASAWALPLLDIGHALRRAVPALPAGGPALGRGQPAKQVPDARGPRRARGRPLLRRPRPQPLRRAPRPTRHPRRLTHPPAAPAPTAPRGRSRRALALCRPRPLAQAGSRPHRPAMAPQRASTCCSTATASALAGCAARSTCCSAVTEARATDDIAAGVLGQFRLSCLPSLGNDGIHAVALLLERELAQAHARHQPDLAHDPACAIPRAIGLSTRSTPPDPLRD